MSRKSAGKKTRILVTGTRGIPDIQGGIEIHCEELYPRIAALGQSITITRRKPYVNDTASSFKKIALVTLPAPRKKHFEAIAHTFSSIIFAWQNRFTHVHIHAIGPSLLAPLARMLGLKVIVTHHGQDYKRKKWGRLSRLILRLGELSGIIFSHRVIAVSKHIRKRLAIMYGRKDCSYIPNGITAGKKTDADDFLRLHGLEKKSYILAAGRFVPEKGFRELVAAWVRLEGTKPKLVIAGDADHETGYSRALKIDARKHGVVLTGFIQRQMLAQLYSHARLFVIPSTHEGLPLVLLEALSFGLSIIASDIPPHREIGLDPSSYFPPGDVNSLSRVIAYKLEHQQEFVFDMRLLEEYNWDIIAQQTIEVYGSV